MVLVLMVLIYSLSPRDADMDVGGRATHGAVAERIRERG
jgi:hypothetical protein